jgi:hypothetical protein
MKNRFYRISLLAVIAALVFSTMGVTTIAFSCPMGADMEKGCPKCKHTASLPVKSEGCCKTTVTRSVLKTEFEKLGEFKTAFSLHMTIPVYYQESYLVEDPFASSITLSHNFLAFYRLTSVEKCALLSTFLI